MFMGMGKPTIERKPLLKAAIRGLNVDSVDVREIRFAPGQKTGRHLHPSSVFDYIAEGTAVFQIEGQPPQILPLGSAFHEPAPVVIADFRNASDAHPLTLHYVLPATWRAGADHPAGR
jgi:quercetin dioxygenase-like cupin family protein